MSQSYPSALSGGIQIAIKKNVHVPSLNVPGPFHKRPHLSRLSAGIQIAIKKKRTCPKCRNVSTEQAPLLRKETNKTRLSRMSPVSQASKRLFSEKCPECPRHSKQASGIMMPCPKCLRCLKQANCIHNKQKQIECRNVPNVPWLERASPDLTLSLVLCYHTT